MELSLYLSLSQFHWWKTRLHAYFYRSLPPSPQSRLAELYQSASQEAQSKVEDLISGAEAMQQLLEEVSQEKEKLQLQLNEATIRSDKGFF